MAAGLFKRHINRSIAGNILVFLFLLVFGIFFVFPIFYTVITSFKPLEEIFIFRLRLFVRDPTLDNFIELDLMTASFWVPLSRYIFNSLFISVCGTAGHLLLACMAAYPMAKHPFPGNGWMKQLIVMSLLFTSAVTYLPQYVVIAQLHLVNTYWALILPAVGGSLGLYLMMNFMSTLPTEMIEAARIDGASEFRIYAQVIMPNVKPAWLTLIIFSFRVCGERKAAS